MKCQVFFARPWKDLEKAPLIACMGEVIKAPSNRLLSGSSSKNPPGQTQAPAPNGLIDLWAQMFLLDQGAALGRTLGGYRDQYFRVTKYAAVTLCNGPPAPGPKPKFTDGWKACVYR